MNIPESLKYTAEHEWVKIEGNVATVGITDFAQGELGDIVFADIESEGEELEKGEEFGALEAVKTVAELYMPLSGTVSEFNEALEDAPELINTDPYGEGWIIKIEFTDEDEIEDLLDAAGYKAVIE